MLPDLSLLLVAAILIVVCCGILFLFENERHRSSSSGRLWALAVIFAIFSALCYLLAALSDNAVWAIVSANATMAMTFGALWSGTRAFNGKRSFLPHAIAISTAVGVASLIPDDGGYEWAGTAERLIAVGALSLMTVYETLRAPLSTYLGGKVLAVVLALNAIVVFSRMTVLVFGGPDSDVFLAYFNPEISTVINSVFIIFAGLALVAIRVQAALRIVNDRNGGSTVVTPRRLAYRVAAASALREAGENPSSILEVRVELFEELGIAHGMRFASEVSDVVVEAIVASVPRGAVVFRRGKGEATVLLPGVPLGEAVDGIRAAISERFAAAAGQLGPAAVMPLDFEAFMPDPAIVDRRFRIPGTRGSPDLTK